MAKLTTSSYVKIALVALLCLVLCGGIAGCSLGCTSAARHAGTLFDDMGGASTFSQIGDASVPASQVRSIEVYWLAGSVDVQVADDDEDEAAVVATEKARGSMPDSMKMAWQLSGDTLQIGYSRGSIGLVGCSMPAKHLTLSIPRSIAQSLESVSLSAASGTYDLEGIGCERLSIDLASGQAHGEGLTARALSLDVASGNVSLAGRFSEQMDINVASGDIKVESPDACPARTFIDLASGHVDLAIPADSSFVASVDRLSGSFICELPEASARAHHSGSGCIHGSGDAVIDVSLASGQVTLTPAEDR